MPLEVLIDWCFTQYTSVAVVQQPKAFSRCPTSESVLQHPERGCLPHNRVFVLLVPLQPEHIVAPPSNGATTSEVFLHDTSTFFVRLAIRCGQVRHEVDDEVVTLCKPCHVSHDGIKRAPLVLLVSR